MVVAKAAQGEPLASSPLGLFLSPAGLNYSMQGMRDQCGFSASKLLYISYRVRFLSSAFLAVPLIHETVSPMPILHIWCWGWLLGKLALLPSPVGEPPLVPVVGAYYRYAPRIHR